MSMALLNCDKFRYRIASLVGEISCRMSMVMEADCAGNWSEFFSGLFLVVGICLIETLADIAQLSATR